MKKDSISLSPLAQEICERLEAHVTQVESALVTRQASPSWEVLQVTQCIDVLAENDRLRAMLSQHGAAVPPALGKGNILNEVEVIEQNEALEKQAIALGLSVAKTGNAPAAGSGSDDSLGTLQTRLANLERSRDEVLASINETRASRGLPPFQLPGASTTSAPASSAPAKKLTLTEQAMLARAAEDTAQQKRRNEQDLRTPPARSWDPDSPTGRALTANGQSLDTTIHRGYGAETITIQPPVKKS